MMMEKLEIFNRDGTPTGKIVDRNIIHEKGFWHRVSHIWIYNDRGEVLIQKRSKNKDAHPGLWDISAAGHIDIDESPETAAVREANEELGIDINRDKLEFFDLKYINLKDKRHGIIDNEITYIYLYRFNGNIKDFHIDPEEVSEIKYIDVDELKERLKNPETKINFVPFDISYYTPIIDHILKITK